MEKYYAPYSLIYLLNYLLTPSSKNLLEKLRDYQLIKNFPTLLLKPKVHYRIHNCPPPVPILCLLHSGHIRTFHFLKIHLNNIALLLSDLPSWTLPTVFPHQNTIYNSPDNLHAICHSKFILLDFINWKISGEQYRSLSNSLFIFLHSHVFSFLQGPNILHIIINHYKILYNHSILDVQRTTPSTSQKKSLIICVGSCRKATGNTHHNGST